MSALPVKLVVVGHVGHGKSTLVGRLLHETGSFPDGKLEELRAVSERRGMPLEWSFALDSFQAERDHSVTIDTTRIWLKTKDRETLIIDAPGHHEFLGNMVSGAAAADAAILVVDAAEGVREETRRHGYLLHLLGISQVAVAIDKIDLVEFSPHRVAELEAEVRDYLGRIRITPRFVVPISARHGDNLAERSPRTHWYDGPTLLGMLDAFAPAPAPTQQPLRLPLQDVYRFDERRILVGRIETGRVAVGDMLLFSPSNEAATVKTIEAWNAPAPAGAEAGRSVGLTLDRPIVVERGDMASHVPMAPLLTNSFRATLFWLGARPLDQAHTYQLQLGTAEAPVTIQSVERIFDTETLGHRDGGTLAREQIGEVVLHSRRLLSVDDHRRLPRTGRFVLRDGSDTVAGGLISTEGVADQRPAVIRSSNITPVDHYVTATNRARRYGHKGGVLWFTGLSGAGKSTLAMAVEQHLFRKGYSVYVLDGDNVRRGLNANLGFSPEDRAENIRRVGEVAALFADAGLLCITAFISPYRADRDRARAAAGSAFHEIYLSATLATCEQRDPKGLYRRARAGEIRDFTGISAPYEPPAAPELVIDTTGEPLEASLETMLRYVERNFALTARKG